jgi:predicted RNA-binding Zn-ribbon protein involved in translation (DUF1610 family)
MGFTIRQDCPQCGAPIELDETDRILHCPYCDVKSYLFTPRYFRYLLPHKAEDKALCYAPYLRFKGTAYFCEENGVGHRIVDITHKGVPLDGIPISLGLRPQAMKMRFVTPKTEGSFLRFTLKAADILARAAKLTSSSVSGDLHHRTFIGETLSLIYFPLYVENNLIFDAVLNRPLASLPNGTDVMGENIKVNPHWALKFIPTLCPHCGWNLEGKNDSVVLACKNCESLWETAGGKLDRVTFSTVPAVGDEALFLPFWRINARSTGVELRSYADFLRVTGQPGVLKKAWEKQDMHYWTPAFKIRPKVFLRLSKQLTVAQAPFEAGEWIPMKNRFPVTLPREEALQSMKITLAGSALKRNRVFPFLQRTKFDIRENRLVYLPFHDTGHDYVQEHLGVGVNKNSLVYGRIL